MQHQSGNGTGNEKFLTFKLGDESYGINVLTVREIVSVPAITLVPQMPADVRGVINLRGKIIPVLDLRRRFGFPDAGLTEQSCIIVVQVKSAGGTSHQQGLLVDTVEEVLPVSAADVEAPPQFGGGLTSEYLVGLAKIKGKVKALLDMERVLGVAA